MIIVEGEKEKLRVIELPCEINGKESSALIDTGAEQNYINGDHADELGLVTLYNSYAKFLAGNQTFLNKY